MNVLMVNHPGSPGFHGGDLVQMRKTADVLRTLGVRVVESFDPRPDARGFDLAHVFNLRTVAETAAQVRHLKDQSVPIVLSPIYLDPSLALWATQGILAIFRSTTEEATLANHLVHLRSRDLKVHLEDGSVLTAGSTNRHRPDYDRLQRDTLALVDHLIPNSVLEHHALARSLRVCSIPFKVAYYGADSAIFQDADPEPFVRKYGLRDFVLQVGRIEPSKNQLLLARALRHSGMPLVLIGTDLQPEYTAWVRRDGPEGMLVLPHLPPEELASAYAAARVHALPSWIETCGLVGLEAALAGCSLVASIAGYEVEYLENFAWYCDPGDEESIRTAVQNAWENHERQADRRQLLRQRILTHFTWQRAGEETLRAYEQVLGARASRGP